MIKLDRIWLNQTHVASCGEPNLMMRSLPLLERRGAPACSIEWDHHVFMATSSLPLFNQIRSPWVFICSLLPAPSLVQSYLPWTLSLRFVLVISDLPSHTHALSWCACMKAGTASLLWCGAPVRSALTFPSAQPSTLDYPALFS